jgi:hypothetical protein
MEKTPPSSEMASVDISLSAVGRSRLFSTELPEMCEDHAEMLERGVDNSSAPATPYERPRAESIASFSPPLMDLGERSMKDHQPSGNNSCSTSMELHHPLQHYSDANCIIKESPSLLQNGNEVSRRRSERFEADLILKQQELTEDNGAASCNSEDTSTEDTSFTSKTSTDQLEAHAKKYHRRLQESAQFAEAVGEPQNGMIQVIIDESDDDESDDDDDDDNDEVPPIISGGASLHSDNDSELGLSVGQEEQETEACGIPDVTAPLQFHNSFTSMQVQLDLISQREARNNFESPLPEGDSLQFISIDEDIVSDGLHVPTSPIRVEANDTGRFPSERSLSESNLDKLNRETREQEETSWKPKSLSRRSTSYQIFRHKLPLEESECDRNNDVFKGIVSPEVTKRGITRGNYAQLHRKAWLEVSDRHHRYGKNLRAYYKHWERLDHPTNMFFDWLDVKGEAEGWELPNLPECPREQLDSDRVVYINDVEDQSLYLLKIVPQEKSCCSDEHRKDANPSKIVDVDGNPVQTGSSGWIFVLRDNEIYGAEKRTKPKGEGKSAAARLRFHHSSFFGGKAVAAAGILITDDNGCLTRLYSHSGHYRPGEAHMQRMLFHLHHLGVDLNSFLVDMQQIMHVSREVREARTPKGGTGCDGGAAVDENDEAAAIPVAKKAKKTVSLQLKTATFVALFLGHKARSIGKGVFSMVHKIRPLRRVEPNSVRSVLTQIDQGGVWKNKELFKAHCPMMLINKV